jgi:signal transduction histidine kinase
MRFTPEATRLGIRSSIGVRILGPESALGVIGALSTQPRTFTHDDAAFLQAVANVLGSAWALESAAEQRRAALEALVRSSEEQRAEIATELHDDTIQVMTATLFSLDRLLRYGRDAGDDDLVERARMARDTLAAAVDRTRRLMFELRPPLLDSAGLVVAVKELVAELAAECGFDGRVDSDVGPLSANVESLAYRTVAELLSNVRKHAAAGTVTVELSVAGPDLNGQVRDDGRGFDLGRALDRSATRLHLGLDSTAERLRLAGGELVIDTAPGSGTAASFRIPVEEPVVAS